MLVWKQNCPLGLFLQGCCCWWHMCRKVILRSLVSSICPFIFMSCFPILLPKSLFSTTHTELARALLLESLGTQSLFYCILLSQIHLFPSFHPDCSSLNMSQSLLPVKDLTFQQDGKWGTLSKSFRNVPITLWRGLVGSNMLLLQIVENTGVRVEQREATLSVSLLQVCYYQN